jgi:hypothetical protein
VAARGVYCSDQRKVVVIGYTARLSAISAAKSLSNVDHRPKNEPVLIQALGRDGSTNPAQQFDMAVFASRVHVAAAQAPSARDEEFSMWTSANPTIGLHPHVVWNPTALLFKEGLCPDALDPAFDLPSIFPPTTELTSSKIHANVYVKVIRMYPPTADTKKPLKVC